jgi:hypothetical protein
VPGFTGYVAYLTRIVGTVEQSLQAMFFEMHGGKTPQNVRFRIYRSLLSFTTSFLVLMYFWYLLLGRRPSGWCSGPLVGWLSCT